MAGVQTVPYQAAAITSGGPTQNITPAALSGVTPKGVIVTITSATTAGTNAVHSLLQFGFFDGTNQHSVSGGGQDGAGTSVRWSLPQSGKFIAIPEIDGGDVTDGVATVSMISGGCQINWSEYPSAAYLMQFLFLTGDDMVVKCGFIDSITTSAVNVTGLTGTPEGLFLASCGISTDGTVASVPGESGQIGFGFYDGTRQRSVSRYLRDQQNTARNIEISSTAAIANLLGTTSLDHSLAASGFASGQFTLTPSTDYTGVCSIWMAISTGGNGAFEVQSYDLPVASGNQAFSGFSFEPEAVMLFGSQLTVRDTAKYDSTSDSLSIHLFDASNEYSVQSVDEDGQDPNVAWSRVNTTAIDAQLPGGADVVASVTSLDSNGFTLNFSDPPASAYAYFAIGFKAVAGGGGSSDTPAGLKTDVEVGSPAGSAAITQTPAGLKTDVELSPAGVSDGTGETPGGLKTDVELSAAGGAAAIAATPDGLKTDVELGAAPAADAAISETPGGIETAVEVSDSVPWSVALSLTPQGLKVDVEVGQAAADGALATSPAGLKTDVEISAAGGAAAISDTPAGLKTDVELGAAVAGDGSGETPDGLKTDVEVGAGGGSAAITATPAGLKTDVELLAAGGAAAISDTPAGLKTDVELGQAAPYDGFGDTPAGLKTDVELSAAGGSAAIATTPAGLKTDVELSAAGGSAGIATTPAGLKTDVELSAAGGSAGISPDGILAGPELAAPSYALATIGSGGELLVGPISGLGVISVPDSIQPAQNRWVSLAAAGRWVSLDAATRWLSV